MKLASLEVLRKTAQDVFHEKILLSNLTKVTKNNLGDENENDDDDDDDDDDDSDNDNDIDDDNDIIDIQVPQIDEQDLVIGRVLGRGAFCVVRECSFSVFSSNASGRRNISCLGRKNKSSHARKNSFRFSNNGRQSISRYKKMNGNDEITSGTSSSSTGCNDQNYKTYVSSRRKGGNNRTRYVMKQLSSDLKRSDKINFMKGTVDLAMETRFLASLQHDNIISLQGISNNGAFSDGFFIILERVNETLGRKVKFWMDIDRQCKGITGFFTGSKKKAHRLQSERISAACDLAAAMDFLHRKNIVFRDLKPDNIGFDINGVLKLFDFGLAKELRGDERLEDGLYKMTGCTGSIRYMSPENVQGKPYNLTTDVYSWSMIMWNILALEPPFALYTEQMIIDRVCNRGYRPKIFSTWSTRMSKIISRSWSANTKDRPSFEEISVELKIELNEVKLFMTANKTGK